MFVYNPAGQDDIGLSMRRPRFDLLWINRRCTSMLFNGGKVRVTEQGGWGGGIRAAARIGSKHFSGCRNKPITCQNRTWNGAQAETLGNPFNGRSPPEPSGVAYSELLSGFRGWKRGRREKAMWDWLVPAPPRRMYCCVCLRKVYDI